MTHKIEKVDATGNIYIIPKSLEKEFEEMDQAIVDTYDEGCDSDLHVKLCNEWFDKFDHYWWKEKE